jgi:hypothetical protein
MFIFGCVLNAGRLGCFQWYTLATGDGGVICIAVDFALFAPGRKYRDAADVSFATSASPSGNLV